MKEKRFPTILGIILLITILIAGVYLSMRTTTLSSKASSSCEPINPQITNLTYGSFDFSFTTISSCTPTLVIANKIYQDSSSASTTHYFKISDLSTTTSYQFKIISNGITYSRSDYTLTTTVKPNSSIPTSSLAWGRILNSASQPISGAIVYLTIPGSQALSAFSNKDGNWNISFATSFNESKTDWFNPTSAIEEDIIVYSPDGQLTQITNNSNNNDPVPDIIVGQNYFSSVPTPTTITSLGTGSGDSTSVSFSITSPSETETISTLKPDIFGKGPANTTFKLSLDGGVTSVVVASNNVWHWSPSKSLSIGSHKLILTYGSQSITRNFTVSQNSNLAFSASSSASLITPTLALTSTPIPTIKPTLVPTAARAAQISTTSALYKSGATFPTYFLIILSTLLFSVSLYYYRR